VWWNASGDGAHLKATSALCARDPHFFNERILSVKWEQLQSPPRTTHQEHDFSFKTSNEFF
jgi:predicted HD phosphohydrolase